MKRIHLLVLLSVLALPFAAASASGSGAGTLVVAEVFAAGGNSGAAYANDYVELFNRGAAAVAVDGWTLQYASAAGTTWQATALSGTIPAGGRYLVQLASGGVNGAGLPTPDATGTSNLAVTGGKVALVDTATALSCGTSERCAWTASIDDGNSNGNFPSGRARPTSTSIRAASLTPKFAISARALSLSGVRIAGRSR